MNQNNGLILLIAFLLWAIFFSILIYMLYKQLKDKPVSKDINKPFNNLSVVLFILFLIFGWLVGFFQYISLKQIGETGERGSGLAKICITLSWLPWLGIFASLPSLLLMLLFTNKLF